MLSIEYFGLSKLLANQNQYLNTILIIIVYILFKKILYIILYIKYNKAKKKF